MSVSLINLLRYWRASLQDSAQHVDAESLALYEAPLADLAVGEVSVELCDQLWENAAGTVPATILAQSKTIPVLIAPVFLCSTHEQGQVFSALKKAQVPLWLAGQCDHYGKIKLNEKVRPQDAFVIDRDVIAPLSSSVPTYTTLEAVDTFLDKTQLKPVEGGHIWQKVWEHVERLFDDVFSTSPTDWSKGQMFNHGAFIAYGERPVDTGGAIRTLYERVIEQVRKKQDPPPLLAAIANEERSSDAEHSVHCRSAMRFSHNAQMGGAYPLNVGQRKALSAVLAASEASIVAVNGPPGTGKTTLLQSIVGSLWVQSAIEGKEPPVILASSTNNQAITNILDSFSKASLPDNHGLSNNVLSKRWIPEVQQYGLFLPSETRAKTAGKTYQIASCPNRKAWVGLPALIENKDFVSKAEMAWLEAAELWDSRAQSVEEGVNLLHIHLCALEKNVKKSWKVWDVCHPMLKNEASDQSIQESVQAWEKRKLNLDRHLLMLRNNAHGALAIFHTPLSLLSWIPFIKRRIWLKVFAYLDKRRLTDKSWTWQIVLSEKEFCLWLTKRQSLIEKQQKIVSQKLEKWKNWEGQLKSLISIENPAALILSEEVFQKSLDIHVRTEMFLVASRYWEGRWLLEMKKLLEKVVSKPKLLSGWNKENCEARWRRFAKLTPCLVATAYTAPRAFEYYNGSNQSLLDFVDLLIIEEAGQVAPHVGSALFALAKRAVVVGDTQQIEPVWGVSASIDGGNRTHYELKEVDPMLIARGMAASDGSIMKMAQAATTFSSKGHAGMFLDEHWRCRHSTIAYCNDLAYDGKLTPMRQDGSADLPPLGYAHISGDAERRGTSWANPTEASIIASWIYKNKEHLTKNRKLAEAMAIVTPFKAQIPVLQKALKEQGLSDEKIVVGTIHTLQGAEKDIVLFSSVYNADSTKSLFFDRGVNMLNVAVSRAKESFLVFGDMRLFRPESLSTPSGLLARHLFNDPANEILDVEPTLAARIAQVESSEKIERIDDLDGHRFLLRRAFEEAQEKLLIVSPFLSINAIEADDLLVHFDEALKRGVRIVVCYDPHLNEDENGNLYTRAQDVLLVLEQRNVEIWPIAPAHNKTLAVDDLWIAEGSFNWLSASRKRDGIYQRYETSILCQGGKALQFVEQAWESAQKLRVTD